MKYNFDEKNDRIADYSAKYCELELKYGHSDLLPLWIADMDFKVASPIVDAIMNRAHMGIFGYTTRPESYTNSIIEWFREKHNWDIRAEWLMFSPGVIPSISMIIQELTDEDDEIIIQEPVYSPFNSTVKNTKRNLVINPLKKTCDGNYLFDLDDLKSKITDKTKLLILCNPHNPVGRVWTRDELKSLGDICLEHNIRVISDEIHCDLVFSGYKHIPFASLGDKYRDICITCLAPSKTFNIPGLQASMIVIPDKTEYKIIEDSFTRIDIKRNNCFSLVATEAAYSKGSEWLQQAMDYIEANADYVCAYINEHIPKLKVIKPEGTYLMWIDFSSLGLSDDELNLAMINDCGLALNPGIGFGIGGSGYQRINIACPRSIIEEALSRLKNLVDNYNK